MILLRQISRLLMLILWTMSLIVPAILLNLIFILSYTQRTKTLALLTMLWAKFSCRILGIRVEPLGDLNIDQQGFIVSNHISYTDIMVLAGLMPAVFLSKQDVRRWPLVGLLSILAGTVFIDRSAKSGIPAAIKGMTKKMNARVNAVVFPEGTTSDSSDVMPFKSSFFELPLLMNSPVIPVSISYDAPRCTGREKPVAWYGKEPFLRHFWRLLSCAEINASVFFNKPILYQSNDNPQARKDLAAEAYRVVRERYKNLSA